MAQESANNSILGLSNIFTVAPFAFQVIDQIAALSCGFVDLLLNTFCTIAEWEILLQYFQVCGLLHSLDWVIAGWLIFQQYISE